MKLGTGGRRRFAALAAVAVLGTSACGGAAQSGDSSVTKDGVTTYKMGVAMALSGSQAALGQDFVTFVQYGIEDVNKQYAKDGFRIELVTEDTAGTADVGLKAFNKLASVEQTPVVFTAWSAVVKAMAPAAKDVGVALINSGANSPELEGAGENLRNFFPLASNDVAAVSTYMAEHEKKKRAAIIHVDNATGQGAAGVYEKSFEKAGGKIVAVESIRQDAVDASAQVAKVLAAKPDTIHVHALLGEAPVIFKALKEKGNTAPLTTYAGLGEAVAVRTASGSSMNGLTYTTLASTSAEDPKIKALVERFVKEKDREPAGLSYDVYMYDSAFFFAEIVKGLRAADKPVTGENILAAIDDTASFPLPLQKSTEFTDTGIVRKPVILKKISDVGANPAADQVLTTIEP
ncbi:MAG TPA: ABC transporter substrate-binding protein [Mycobacteriales bacterium]|nr:ABC transporter substrate-binding protein [Mycobacteriales bacterium]